MPNYYHSGIKTVPSNPPYAHSHTMQQFKPSSLFQKHSGQSIVQMLRMETTHHFFIIHCPLYTEIRTRLNISLTQLAVPRNHIRIILYGCSTSDDETNALIFRFVQDYIIRSKRFPESRPWITHIFINLSLFRSFKNNMTGGLLPQLRRTGIKPIILYYFYRFPLVIPL